MMLGGMLRADVSGMNENTLAVVAGATGYLGSHVARALRGAGYKVRGLSRREGALDPEIFDEIFIGEATDAASLKGLCEGAEVCFSSVGIRHARRRPTFWEVDRDANLNIVAEAQRGGVSRFVFTSVFGGAEARGSVRLCEAREQVVDRLRDARMETMILRPTGLFNDMAGMFEMALRGRYWMFGDGTARLNPVHGADVADAVVDALGKATLPEELNIGGPRSFSVEGIGELAFGALERPSKISSVPLFVLPALIFLGGLWSPNLAAILEAILHSTKAGGEAPAFGHRRLQRHFADLAGAPR